nr:HEAT repeat domain-containing protein [Verrucomicrobiota bacterium]
MLFPNLWLQALLPASILGLLASSSLAQPEPADGKKKDDRHPETVSADDTAEMALKKFSVAPGLRAEIWAAEPLLANPVALAFDEKGRAFVAETFRRRSSVPDIRKNEPWTIENLALRTVEERVALFKEKYPEPAKLNPAPDRPDLNGDGQFDWRDWEVESERVKLVEDSDGDGKADRSSVFADGFNTVATGVGAGVIARGGQVWYACVPDLWRLSGEQDGRATRREKLISGFGVHVAYSGHDMHGLRFGPDGKLYWTIADCGAAARAPAGKSPSHASFVDLPDTGAVFRANPDGTGFEVVMIGLRNPQHLAFNDVGDLFTGDNNGDGGDAARWVHVVEGGDAGWRIGWQFLPKLGAWNAEQLWGLDPAATPLTQLPPVAHIGHGPAGIAYYPGTGLPERYAEHFFYADFPGGVRAFKLEQKGASYTAELDSKMLQDNSAQSMTGKLLWGLYPSDVQFGVDGGAYVLDWVQGWEKTGKGRIYRVHDPEVSNSPVVLQTRKLLAEGMEQRTAAELSSLLGHADQRVRLAAQFELVARGRDAAEPLVDVARNGKLRLARLHAIWAMAQVHRTPRGPRTGADQSLQKQTASLEATFTMLLDDPDSEVRAQAVKAVGELSLRNAESRVRALLKDPAPRVRFFAAMTAGRMDGSETAPALVELLRQNADRDPFIRHAAAFSLARQENDRFLRAAAADPSEAVRAGVLRARIFGGDPRLKEFLADPSPRIRLEAARALHDGAITLQMLGKSIGSAQGASGAGDSRSGLDLEAVADLLKKPEAMAEPLFRRAINAAFVRGREKNLLLLIGAAGNESAPEALRVAGLGAIADWEDKALQDRFTGLYRPAFQFFDGGDYVEERARIESGKSRAAQNVLHLLSATLASGSAPVRLESLRAVEKLKMPGLDSPVAAIALNGERDS